MKIIRNFIELNVKITRHFEKLVNNNKKDIFRSSIMKRNASVADFGGGRRPTLSRYPKFLARDATVQYCCGFDIDEDELLLAPTGYYTEVAVMDLSQLTLESRHLTNFDVALCINTLEHVENVRLAIKNMALSLKPGGLLFLKLPCRHALFAKINMMLAPKLSQTLLFAIYPSKKGTDGFEAFYDNCTPLKIEKICNEFGLRAIDSKRIYSNDIFAFFIPIYLIWRLITAFQYLLIPDYCESMEFIFEKNSDDGLNS